MELEKTKRDKTCLCRLIRRQRLKILIRRQINEGDIGGGNSPEKPSGLKRPEEVFSNKSDALDPRTVWYKKKCASAAGMDRRGRSEARAWAGEAGAGGKKDERGG